MAGRACARSRHLRPSTSSPHGRTAAGDRGKPTKTDLMPYEVLDAIERLAIRDKQRPLEVFDLLRRAQFPQYSAAASGRVGRAILSALVPQSMEAGTIRAVVPPGRRKP